MLARVLAAALICALSLPAFAQEERKLVPIDEGASDVSWLRFKKRLMDAIQKRDRQFLLSVLDKNVRNQSERARGVAQFRKEWELDTPDTPVWRELSTALQLGAAYLKRDNGRTELCAPYLLGRWPADVTPFDHGAIVSRDTGMHAEPSPSSSTLARLSYDIVEVTDWEVADKASGQPQKWVRVRHRGREGYVLEEHVRSPIEQAACFAKSGNAWRMTGFAPAGGE
jgi:hypothetical protein